MRHLVARCNDKTRRQLNANLLNQKMMGVIIIQDADNQLMDEIKVEIKSHIPINYPLPIEILLFKYQIEELILLQKGYQTSINPVEELTKIENYKKKDLLKYAKTIDISKISNHKVIEGIIDFFNSFTQ